MVRKWQKMCVVYMTSAGHAWTNTGRAHTLLQTDGEGEKKEFCNIDIYFAKKGILQKCGTRPMLGRGKRSGLCYPNF